MIDTVVLTLSSDMFIIHDPDAFTPSAHWITSPRSHQARGMISKQNPSKKELREGIYKPRLTLWYRTNVRGIKDVVLKIELSLPKLLFGNNFEELNYKDLTPLIEQLSLTLADMGIGATCAVLEEAPVTTIHFSKNIPLKDGMTPYYLLSKIKEANIRLSLDVNQTDFRNDGHSYKWHCNSYEVVFYDKIRDLEAAKKSEKRAMEKDNALQLNLFKTRNVKKKFELLRMEVRLNTRKKMKHLFEKLGIKTELTLKKLCKPAIAKKVLLHYLDELAAKRPALLNVKATTDKALLATMFINNPGTSPKQILQTFGLKKALETMTLRELQLMLGGQHKKSWQRLMKELETMHLPTAQDPLELIRTHLATYKPIRFK